MGILYNNSNYLFKTTNSGISVYDIDGAEVDFIEQYGVTSVWADDLYLYFGTSGDGVGVVSVSDFSNKQEYKKYPYITSDFINYIHGSSSYLCICTISGVDQINTSTDDRIYTLVSGTSLCHQSEDGGFYYVIGGDLCAVYDNTANWDVADFYYRYDNGFLFDNSLINDFCIIDGYIYLATTNGVVIIEENVGDEYNADVKYVLKG